MNSLPLKVMIFGAKYASYCLIPAFKNSGLVKVVGICSPSEINRKLAAKTHNINKTFSNFEDALKETNFNIAAIAVPPSFQKDIALKCINNGIHIFAEKPLTTNLKSAKLLLRKSERKNIKTAVDFLFPETITWKKAKKLISNNQIGNLHHLIVNWNVESFDNRQKIKTWKTNSKLGGGSFSHFGSHLLHYLEWFCGPIKKLNKHLYSYPNYFDSGDTMASINVLFESGVSSTANLCTAAPNGLGHRLDFFGDDGTLSLINETKNYLDFTLQIIDKNNKTTLFIEPKINGSELKFDQRVVPITRLVKRFVISIMKNKEFKPSFKQACDVQNFLEIN